MRPVLLLIHLGGRRHGVFLMTGRQTFGVGRQRIDREGQAFALERRKIAENLEVRRAVGQLDLEFAHRFAVHEEAHPSLSCPGLDG